MESKANSGEPADKLPSSDDQKEISVNLPRACPTDDELASLLDSRQPEGIEQWLEDHLADCSNCVDRLDSLSTRDSKGLFHHWLQGHRQPTSPFPFQARDTDAQAGATIATISSYDEFESLPVVPGYQIEKEMARGGMGVVFRAIDKRLDRSVALKMVMGGLLAGPERISRFTEEAKTIAKLDHPNIVKVFEVGEFRGQPFFTMELIEGANLESKMHGVPWSVDRTVRLLRSLASALKATHEQGIVHRDLKPGNILVQTSEELTDHPRIIDFGLAKNFASIDLTLTGEVMGTPSYMSPEQASGKNDQIGAESDVYSLGCILYELLTGRPPFRAATLTDTIQQVLYSVPVNPRALNASIPIDLETICLKCLRKDPARRYAHGGQLADDLARFSTGRPINARRTSVWERGVKWCRRHPTTTIVSLVLSISIVVVLVIWIRFTNDLATQSRIATAESKRAKENELIAIENEKRATRNEKIALAQLKRAERASAIQTETQQFILDLVQDVSAHGKDKELVQVLLDSEEKLNDRLDKRPLVKAVYLITLANTLQNFGEYDKSLEISHRAEKLVREYDSPDSNYLARAQLVQLSIYLLRQEFPKAEEIVKRLSKEGVHFHEVDKALFELQKANFEFLTGNVKDSERRLRKLLEQLDGQDSSSIRLQVNRLLSIVLLELGEVNRAEPYLMRSVEMARETYPAGHPTLVATENAYGIFLSKSGRAHEAEQLFAAALERTRKTWGEEHPKTIETTNNLAIALGRQGKFAEAETRFHESIDLAIRHLGRRHTLTINTMRSLAAFHVEQKSYKQGFLYLSQVCHLKSIEEVAHVDAGKLALYYSWICLFAEEWQQAEECLNCLEKIIGAIDQPTPELRRDLLSTRKELKNRRSD